MSVEEVKEILLVSRRATMAKTLYQVSVVSSTMAVTVTFFVLVSMKFLPLFVRPGKSFLENTAAKLDTCPWGKFGLV